MKIIQKARIAGAVMLATAGIAVSTAQADNLLAPLIINDTANGVGTFLSLRTGGTNPGKKGLHYYWIQKNHPQTAPVDVIDPNDPQEALLDLDRNCKVVNSYGDATQLDMVYQSTIGDAGFNALPIPGINTVRDANGDVVAAGVDESKGAGFAGNFAGMLVIDVPSLEGDFLGFAYIFDAVNGTMMEYKMLNNHQTDAVGNFQNGFMAKKSIDYSWVPETLASTMWYSAVLGKEMADKPEQAGVYDATVLIGSDARMELDGTSNQASPQLVQGGKGVFNNEENFLSGARDLSVTCVGMYDRMAFIDASQRGFTANGGWTRRSISPVAGKVIDAKGALTYKMEKPTRAFATNALGWPVAQNLPVSFIVETSGNLSENGTKANKPN